MREQSPIPPEAVKVEGKAGVVGGKPLREPTRAIPLTWWPGGVATAIFFFLYLFYFFLLLSTTFRHQVCVCVLDGIS